jgi:hypothetical protein
MTDLAVQKDGILGVEVRNPGGEYHIIKLTGYQIRPKVAVKVRCLASQGALEEFIRNDFLRQLAKIQMLVPDYSIRDIARDLAADSAGHR